jgi:glycosyltransferase involved in cell wall biosynthesis
MSAPRVSVLMSAYNAMPYLPAAVESVLGQTFTDFEFVVIDDGSADGTAEYLRSVSDPRMRVITQANAGLAVALNHGIEHCRGEYIARMDADDISLPERFAHQVAFLDAHPDVGCVGTQTAPFGDLKLGGNLNLPTEHEEIYEALATGRHGLVHPSVMMRTDLARKIGGYWSMRVVAEDYDFFLRLGEITRLACVNRVLYHMRFHMASLNGSGMLRMRRAVDYACDRTRRRNAGLPEISFDQFVAARNGASWGKRVVEAIDAHARAQYRASVAEFCGGQPVVGYARLAWAAVCAPTLTARRIMRTFQPRTGQ